MSLRLFRSDGGRVCVSKSREPSFSTPQINDKIPEYSGIFRNLSVDKTHFSALVFLSAVVVSNNSEFYQRIKLVKMKRQTC